MIIFLLSVSPIIAPVSFYVGSLLYKTLTNKSQLREKV